MFLSSEEIRSVPRQQHLHRPPHPRPAPSEDDNDQVWPEASQREDRRPPLVEHPHEEKEAEEADDGEAHWETLDGDGPAADVEAAGAWPPLIAAVSSRDQSHSKEAHS